MAEQLSRSPHVWGPGSYEAMNLKRTRAGSISGRLRAASELEEKGAITNAQKGTLKNLIIAGDAELQSALDRYDQGDASQVEDLIRRGALNRRASIDLLEGLDFDFLNVGGDDGVGEGGVAVPGGADVLPVSAAAPTTGAGTGPTAADAVGAAAAGGRPRLGTADIDFSFDASFEEEWLNSAAGIGVPPPLPPQRRGSDGSNSSNGRRRHAGSQGEDIPVEGDDDSSGVGGAARGRPHAASGQWTFPSDIFGQSQVPGGSQSTGTVGGGVGDGGNRAPSGSIGSLSMLGGPRGPGRGRFGSIGLSGLVDGADITGIPPSTYNLDGTAAPLAGSLGQSLSALQAATLPLAAVYGDGGEDDASDPAAVAAEAGTQPQHSAPQHAAFMYGDATADYHHHQQQQQQQQEQHQREPQPQTQRDFQSGAGAGAGPHGVGGRRLPGPTAATASSGATANAAARPAFGFHQGKEHHNNAEAGTRVQVGAYSPEARRKRIEKYLDKRTRRVWTKKVKYNVRKNFADSRLRVKGRFVKKQDEQFMRDLITNNAEGAAQTTGEAPAEVQAAVSGMQNAQRGSDQEQEDEEEEEEDANGARS